ncbi:MAG: DUF2304 domain-containing protein [Candidatus Aerophobetes bacterium]|nr:DUF2304 domain-containing protein [Candidatus Aerophobetes bacterium]
MPLRQKIMAISLSVGLLIIIFELVRRKKLREEYSWLWMLTGVIILILAVWYDLLLFIAHLVGAALPASVLFFLGIFFLVLINLYFSVKVSTLTTQVKKLTQEIAILNRRVEDYSSER